MNELLIQVKNLWKQMDTTRRVSAVVVLLLVLGAIIFLVVMANRPQYQLLYSSLTEQDRAEIIAKLDELKIPYRVTAGGGLEVPHALSVRANLLKAGIPHGGVVGWEIFDQNSFSATDFTNQINRQRAIAGELTRTLQNFDGILNAKIMLNLPDSSEYIFTENKPEGTASVQLQLRAPGILSESQVAAIANLLAASTGIKPENVTIIDNYANDLSAFMRTKSGIKPGMISASQMFGAKLEYETTAEKKLEGMLSKVFGFNKAVVRVNAELDLDYQELKSETWGDQGVPRSEQERTETYQGGAAASGVPGTDSNITQYKAEEPLNMQPNMDKNERIVNYEINRLEEFRITAPGKVKRQTVGVWVDGDLPETTRRKIENTVAAAIGILAERGDQLTVESIKFTPPPQPEPVPKQLNIPWRQVIMYLILILFLAGLWSAWRKIINLSPDQSRSHSSLPGAAVTGQGQSEQAPPPTIPPLSPEEKVRIERVQALEKIANEKPDEVAALLKNWISEDY